MLFGQDEAARVKIIMAGDEQSLEDKINLYLDSMPQATLASIAVEQTEYHARTGATEHGFIGVLVMRVKRS